MTTHPVSTKIWRYLSPSLFYLAAVFPMLLLDTVVAKALWGWFLTPVSGIPVPAFLTLVGLTVLAVVFLGREFSTPEFVPLDPPPTLEEMRAKAIETAKRLGMRVDDDVVFGEEKSEIDIGAENAHKAMLEIHAKAVVENRNRYLWRYCVRALWAGLVFVLGALVHVLGG